MIRDVPKGTSAVDADIGRTLELSVPGGGTTGYRWEARPADGVEVERLPMRPRAAFGASRNDRSPAKAFQAKKLARTLTMLPALRRAVWATDEPR